MKLLFRKFAIFAMFFATCSCSQATGQLEVGGLYATKNKDDTYSITKILALEQGIVHACFYKDKFKSLPNKISSKQLEVLIGHAPIATEGFMKDTPIKVGQEKVGEAELEGYRLYINAMSNGQQR